MSETPQEILEKHLTHSTRLGNIDLELDVKSLTCEFPSIEHYGYLLKGKGTLVVVSARPGNGKTALTSQIALNVSKYGRALYFSLEMKKEALRQRLIAVTSGVPIKSLAHPIHKDRVRKAAEEQSTYRFDIIDDPGLTTAKIITKSLDEAQKEPIDLIVIDYVGLISFDNSQRALAMSMAVEDLKKKLAEKLKVPVILIAQMKRGFEDRYSRAKMEFEKAKQYPKSELNHKLLEIRPTLEDLAESSGLEKHADVVMFLHRPHLLDPDEFSPSLFNVFVCKNRNGEATDFNLEFSQSLTRFEDHGDVI